MIQTHLAVFEHMWGTGILVVTDKGCWVLPSKKARPYPGGKFGPDKYVRFHVRAAEVHSKRTRKQGEHASHLCGNPFCVCPWHMWNEAARINATRDCCQQWHKHQVGRIRCFHEPECINVKFVEEVPIVIFEVTYDLNRLIFFLLSTLSVVSIMSNCRRHDCTLCFCRFKYVLSNISAKGQSLLLEQKAH
jgi:hypothetical protein